MDLAMEIVGKLLTRFEIDPQEETHIADTVGDVWRQLWTVTVMSDIPAHCCHCQRGVLG